MGGWCKTELYGARRPVDREIVLERRAEFRLRSRERRNCAPFPLLLLHSSTSRRERKNRGTEIRKRRGKKDRIWDIDTVWRMRGTRIKRNGEGLMGGTKKWIEREREIEGHMEGTACNDVSSCCAPGVSVQWWIVALRWTAPLRLCIMPLHASNAQTRDDNAPLALVSFPRIDTINFVYNPLAATCLAVLNTRRKGGRCVLRLTRSTGCIHVRF